MPRPILQPSQVLNVCSYQIDETTGFSNSPANKQAIKSSNGEDQSEENLRRDTYCVKSAKLQASSKLKVKSTPPSHSRSTTPTCKQSAVKTKKVVVSKKKLSPTSGNFCYYTLYSLSVFSLAESLQLILEISATYRLGSYLLADN